MSNDRELLELAAKAAGLEGPFEWVENHETWEGMGCEYFTGLLVGKDWQHWNPLTDDGDALRLAVKLKIELHYDGDGVLSRYMSELRTYLSKPEFGAGEPYAATRRAITRAAAEIGRAM